MDEVSLTDYLRLLYRRKMTIGASVLVVLLLAAVYLAATPRVYESGFSLMIPQPAQDSFLGQLARMQSFSLTQPASGLTGREAYMQILSSRTVSETVMGRLELASLCGVELKDLRESLQLEMPREGGLVVTCRVPDSWILGGGSAAQKRRRAALLSARIANAYLDELRNFVQVNSLSLGRRNRVYVERQLSLAKADLARVEDALERFQVEHPGLMPPDKSFTYSQQVVDMSALQVEADISLAEARDKAASARAMWESGAPRGISPEALVNSASLEDLRGKLAKLEVQRATLLQDLTEHHPDVVSMEQEIGNTRDRIRTEVASMVKGQSQNADPARLENLRQLVLAEITRDGAKARRDALAAALSSLRQRSLSLPPAQTMYARLLRDLKSSETVYNVLLAEQAKARADEGKNPDDFVVLDAAVPPIKPSSPRLKITLVAALAMGLLMGIVIATLQGAPSRTRPR